MSTTITSASTSTTVTSSMTVSSLLQQQQLRNTIQQSKNKIDQWVQDEKQRIDQYIKQMQHNVQEQQHIIDSNAAQLLALQLQHGCTIMNNNNNNNNNTSSNKNNNDNKNNNKSMQLQAEVEMETKIQQEKQQHQLLQQQLQQMQLQFNLRIEVEDIHGQAKMKQQQVQSILSSKDITVNDLTRGMIYYKYLGLDFQKADNDRLKFTFTQLNPNNPLAEYSFCLGTGGQNDDLYSIYDCSPPLHDVSSDILDQLIEPLNRTNDMLSFIRDLRNTFVQYINTSATSNSTK